MTEAVVVQDQTLDGLIAPGPSDQYRDKLMLFGQFVGVWEAEFIVHKSDGTTEIETGEWQWGWILEGRAIGDVWILPRRADRKTSSFERPDIGMTIRSYDPNIDAWRIVWVSPQNHELVTFIARPVEDEIILEGSGMDGTLMRWIFSKVTPNSYHWRRMHSHDAGKTWDLIKEMNVKRVDSRSH
jgi:hypothetical protein